MNTKSSRTLFSRKVRPVVQLLINAPRQVLMLLIRLYQKTLSPDHGPLKAMFPYGYCQYHPTCSEYGYSAIKRHGAIRGTLLTVWRILRCNPFSKGGIDNVPPKK